MATDPRRPITALLAVAAAAALAVTVLTPFLGGSGLDYGKLWRGESPDWEIFLNLRVPRTLLAFLAGAALSLAGALYQAVLREALATPSSLGVTSAAALGAVAAIALGSGEETGFPLVWIAALAGAGLVIALVAALGRIQRFSSFTLLLTGIALSGISTALILLLHSLAGITRSFQIAHWLMGGIDAVSYPVLAALAAAVALGAAWSIRQARLLNVLMLGEAWAAGRGIDHRRLNWQSFAVGAWLVGTVTAITGPIGFVGLIVPHLLRRLCGPDYRLLLPLSLLAGGAFLVLCDTLSRTVLAPVEIPVGVTTALLGGPFFVWLLWSR
ncbi:MAG: FecCD family ABC transporter permease [Acidobacteriota bacterium]